MFNRPKPNPSKVESAALSTLSMPVCRPPLHPDGAGLLRFGLYSGLGFSEEGRGVSLVPNSAPAVLQT